MEDYNPFLLLKETPELDEVRRAALERDKKITENEEICTIVYGRDTFFPFVYPIRMDYKTLQSKYPFTCEENGEFNCSVLFDIKSNMTHDKRIDDAILGYYHKSTIHIYQGEYRC